ncbi:MAG TPA: MOSC domain-containing protein [Blastocatellia bacterium]|nr:MOSC domain-containing protein [Blastocatellia bacterium]
MRLVSVNVGLPKDVVWKGKEVSTGIFKEPVGGRVRVRTLNLDGDRQADLSVHGGPEKAVYAYPSEHYERWRAELPRMNIPFSMFGENLTTEGLFEDQLNIGDRFRIGSARFMVTQPRMPCYKLAIRFQRDDILKRLLQSGRTGFYFSVLEEGDVGAEDEIELLYRDANNVTVADITRLYTDRKSDAALLERAVRVEALPESWRDYFIRRTE